MAKSKKSVQTVAFVSLGCPKNLVDSERMLGLLAEDGLAITADPQVADVIVINTCGFLEASKQESLDAIRGAIEMKTKGRCQRVIVAGCLVQRQKTQLLSEVPDIDRLVGVFDRQHIVEAVRGKENPRQAHGQYLGKYHDLTPSNTKATNSRTGQSQTLPVFEDDRGRLRLTPRHYAYLRISEGCNQGCAFCTIPSIRGPMRSKPVEQILLEAKELAADGAVELNLIGQDTTSYGIDIGYAPGLGGLLKQLPKAVKDTPWIRLMYAYPSCFTDEMIHAIADNPAILPYIDIPLQHINDDVLERMRRRVTRKQIETLLQKLRKWIPGMVIRTTFIAGSPGETDAEHRELVKFVKSFGFDMMGVFPYSQESGTAMGRMDGQLPDETKAARVEELMLAQQKVAFKKADAMKGKTIEVLIDQPGETAGKWIARNKGQAPEIDSITHVSGSNLHLGQLVEVQITAADGYDLIAEVPKKRSKSLTVLGG